MALKTDKRRKVLIVDDDIKNIKLMEGYLSRENYKILSALDGKQALKVVQKTPPDLILLDVMMSGIDGYEVCQRLKGEEPTRLTPIVMVTALGAPEDKIKGIGVGADDFLTKPVDSAELLARVRSLLRVKCLIDQLEQAEHVLYSLAVALEEKDPYIQGHSLRVSQLSTELAQAVGVPEEEQALLGKACLVHDIGKIGVPDTILHKPGPLTREEFAKIEEHPVKSESICKPLVFAAPLLKMIRHHHEWWNGRGYPDHLMFEGIPLGARIMAIADAYDAMTSDRPYRAAMPPMKALDKLEDGAGRQWDPDLVEVFVSIQRKVHNRELKKSYAPLW
ncbi:MAG: HD domain-containing phosphohydrolase [Actinomycetota bacterium]